MTWCACAGAAEAAGTARRGRRKNRRLHVRKGGVGTTSTRVKLVKRVQLDTKLKARKTSNDENRRNLRGGGTAGLGAHGQVAFVYFSSSFSDLPPKSSQNHRVRMCVCVFLLQPLRLLSPSVLSGRISFEKVYRVVGRSVFFFIDSSTTDPHEIFRHNIRPFHLTIIRIRSASSPSHDI